MKESSLLEYGMIQEYGLYAFSFFFVLFGCFVVSTGAWWTIRRVQQSFLFHSKPARYGFSISSLDWQGVSSPVWVWSELIEERNTFFLNCLWMASSASLMVTPFELRAETSNPSGKCRSIFFTGGLTRYNFRMSWSSIVDGEVLSLLE